MEAKRLGGGWWGLGAELRCLQLTRVSTLTSWLAGQPWGFGSDISILEQERLREALGLAEGHTARKEQGWSLTPVAALSSVQGPGRSQRGAGVVVVVVGPGATGWGICLLTQMLGDSGLWLPERDPLS